MVARTTSLCLHRLIGPLGLELSGFVCGDLPPSMWNWGSAVVVVDITYVTTPLQDQGVNPVHRRWRKTRLLNEVKSEDVLKALKEVHIPRRPRATQILADIRDLACEFSWEECMAKFDFVFGYNAIRDVQKQVV